MTAAALSWDHLFEKSVLDPYLCTRTIGPSTLLDLDRSGLRISALEALDPPSPPEYRLIGNMGLRGRRLGGCCRCGAGLPAMSLTLGKAKRCGLYVNTTELCEQHGIYSARSEYVRFGQLTPHARALVKELEESGGVDDRQNAAGEVSSASIGELSPVNDGHLTTALLPQFPEPFPQDSNSAWASLPSVRYAPVQPLLSSDAMMYGDS